MNPNGVTASMAGISNKKLASMWAFIEEAKEKVQTSIILALTFQIATRSTVCPLTISRQRKNLLLYLWILKTNMRKNYLITILNTAT